MAKTVDCVGKLVARLDDFRVGDKIGLTVMRQVKSREVQVILQAEGPRWSSIKLQAKTRGLPPLFN